MFLEIHDPKAPPRAIGIDLGTTNSIVACISNERPVPILDCNGAALVPSIVCFDRDGEVIVGDRARERAASQPKETIVSVKRFIGRAHDDHETRAWAVHVRCAEERRSEPRALRGRPRPPGHAHRSERVHPRGAARARGGRVRSRGRRRHHGARVLRRHAAAGDERGREDGGHRGAPPHQRAYGRRARLRARAEAERLSPCRPRAEPSTSRFSTSTTVFQVKPRGRYQARGDEWTRGGVEPRESSVSRTKRAHPVKARAAHGGAGAEAYAARRASMREYALSEVCDRRQARRLPRRSTRSSSAPRALRGVRVAGR